MSTASRTQTTADTDLAQYRPELPHSDWQEIREFVLAVVEDCAPRLTYPAASVMNAVAHHVDWCVNVAGYSLTRSTVFRRDVIGAATAVMDTARTSTRGRRRSMLLRVGEALEVIPRTPPLAPLAAAAPSAPYTLDEVDGIWHWTMRQVPAKRRPAQVLVALGLGAGLPPRELCSVRAADVADQGRFVQVGERTIPVLADWRTDLVEIAAHASDPSAPLFRPNIAGSKNMVTNFVATCANEGFRPAAQRMRATWLVEHLSLGTPMQDLLWSAGLKSMDALVRYERFLPPPSPTGLEGMS